MSSNFEWQSNGWIQILFFNLGHLVAVILRFKYILFQNLCILFREEDKQKEAQTVCVSTPHTPTPVPASMSETPHLLFCNALPSGDFPPPETRDRVS